MTILLDNLTLVTPPAAGPAAGAGQSRLDVLSGAAIAVADGRIAALGPRDEVSRQVESHSIGDVEVLDLAGRVALPGFVDAHTHPVWAGNRVAELEQRVAGASYVEIAEAGGGIAGTVRQTRAASTGTLVEASLARLDAMMAHGTTTCEAKTGYGLSAAEEMRQLDVLTALDARHPMEVVPTFLGAHAVPDEYRDRPSQYIDLVIDEMLPAVAERNPMAFVDVFCDRGGFDLANSTRVMEKARSLGLRVKVHSDEFENLGCSEVAAGLGAVSADHLVVTGPQAMDALARAGTVAVLLPGTTFGLASTTYAPAREMIARGVAVALGTDLNPGTCPCPSMQLILALAVRYLKLTPAEAIVAATANAAAASGVAEKAGLLARGRPADIVVLNSDDYRDSAYWFGGNLVSRVMIAGEWTYVSGSASYCR